MCFITFSLKKVKQLTQSDTLIKSNPGFYHFRKLSCCPTLGRLGICLDFIFTMTNPLYKFTPKFVLKKQDIQDFPFEEFAEASLDTLDSIADGYGLANFNSWMLPQMLQYFSTWELQYLDTGKIDPKATAVYNIDQHNAWQVGLWKVATRLKRSSLVKKQNAEPGSNYGSLVPLILAAHKKYNNVPYSSWDRSADLRFVVDKNLCAAMLSDPWPDDLTAERTLAIRTEGLTVKSGLKAGQLKNPLSTWSLTGIQHTELASYAPLAVTMLTQIWLAHPSLRNQYMVLDTQDWDSMPKPLIVGDLFKAETFKPVMPKKPVAVEGQDLPWDA